MRQVQADELNLWQIRWAANLKGDVMNRWKAEMDRQAKLHKEKRKARMTKARGNFMGVCIRACENRGSLCGSCFRFSKYKERNENDNT